MLRKFLITFNIQTKIFKDMNFLYAEFRPLRIKALELKNRGIILTECFLYFLSYISFGAAIPNNRSASANTSATHEQ